MSGGTPQNGDPQDPGPQDGSGTEKRAMAVYIPIVIVVGLLIVLGVYFLAT